MKLFDKNVLRDIFSRVSNALQPAKEKILTLARDVKTAFVGPSELTSGQKIYHGLKSLTLATIFASSILSLEPQAIAAAFALGDEVNYLEKVGEQARIFLQNKLS